MGCTTEPEFRSSKPRSCNRSCHPSPPEPGATVAAPGLGRPGWQQRLQLLGLEDRNSGAATVAATRVRQNQELGSMAMATRSLTFPPGGDGMGGLGWQQ